MRKLATVRKISEIHPINGADAIELAIVDGWQSVIKRGEFFVGDYVIYVEIDSWVPYHLAPFLSNGKEPREYNGVQGERLRTIKLRGALSQGLILPVPESISKVEGNDCTEALGIQKWERPIPAQLAGLVRGLFPSEIPKTDQERAQNLTQEIAIARASGMMFDIEEKIEGTSSTFFLDNDGDFKVCSRNLSLKNDDENTFWKVAKELNIQKKMETHNLFGFAIQGEIIGPGIQGNYYGVPAFRLYVFDIYNTNTGKYLTPSERRTLIQVLGLTNVPLIAEEQTLLSIAEILAFADGISVISNKKREGVVFKQSSGGMTFKAISNTYLLSEK